MTDEMLGKMTDEMLNRLMKQFERQATSGHIAADPESYTFATGAGMTADDIRKSINEIKNQTAVRRPPTAILFYGDAYDDFLTSIRKEMVFGEPDPKGINFRTRFEGIPIIRMPNFMYSADVMGMSSAPAMKPVVWRDEVPVGVVPMWQYVIVAMVVGLLLVMLGGVV